MNILSYSSLSLILLKNIENSEMIILLMQQMISKSKQKNLLQLL